MITNFSIKNFKAIAECELSNLKRINLLGGQNNTGKSSVMEALFFLHDRQNPEAFIRLHVWRGGKFYEMTSFDVFAPIFYQYDLSQMIELAAMEGLDKEILSIKSVAELEQMIQIQTNVDSLHQDSHTKSLENHHIEMTVRFEGPKKGKLKKQVISHQLQNDSMGMQMNHSMQIKRAVFLGSRTPITANENAVRYGELAKKNKESVIVKYLQMIEPNLRSITVIQQANNQALLYGDIGLDVKIPLHYMGDGIMRVLAILLSIFTNTNGVVLIDEIENGLHHSILSKVWEMLDQASLESNCQLFITTHSYECLASLVDSQVTAQDVNYIRLERQQEQIVTKEYDYAKLQIAIENGWEVR